MFDGSTPKPAGPVEPHPLEVSLANEWNAGQLANQHIADALGKITAAWRQDRARIAELEARIVERSAAVAERDARIVELEARLAELAKEQVPGIVQWARGEIETIPALSGESAEVQKRKQADREQPGINDDPMAAERTARLAGDG